MAGTREVPLSLLEAGRGIFFLPLRRENGEKTRVKGEEGGTPIKKTPICISLGTIHHFPLSVYVSGCSTTQQPIFLTEMKKKSRPREKESRLFSHVVPAHGQSYSNRKRRSLKNPLSFASFLFLPFDFPGTPPTPLLQVQKRGGGKECARGGKGGGKHFYSRGNEARGLACTATTRALRPSLALR